MNNKKKLLIVDDHELFRAGVVGLVLAEGLAFDIEEAGDIPAAIKALEISAVDCLVVDYELPVGTGLDLIKFARDNELAANIVMLTGTASAAVASQAIEVGANAVISKRGEGDALLSAISGEKSNFISEALTPSTDHAQILARLTPREHEALRILARGASTRELAETMGVSVKTAESHRTNLMSKLDVHSYGNLIKLASDMGVK